MTGTAATQDLQAQRDAVMLAIGGEQR